MNTKLQEPQKLGPESEGERELEKVKFWRESNIGFFQEGGKEGIEMTTTIKQYTPRQVKRNFIPLPTSIILMLLPAKLDIFVILLQYKIFRKSRPSLLTPILRRVLGEKRANKFNYGPPP